MCNNATTSRSAGLTCLSRISKNERRFPVTPPTSQRTWNRPMSSSSSNGLTGRGRWDSCVVAVHVTSALNRLIRRAFQMWQLEIFSDKFWLLCMCPRFFPNLAACIACCRRWRWGDFSNLWTRSSPTRLNDTHMPPVLENPVNRPATSSEIHEGYQLL